MDSFTGLEAARNVIQFVRLGIDILEQMYNYFRNGGCLEYQSLQDLLQQLLIAHNHLQQDLEAGAAQICGPAHKWAVYLAYKQCLDLSNNFAQYLSKFRVPKSRSPTHTVRKMFEALMAENSIKQYQDQVEQCRSYLTLSILVYVSVETATIPSSTQYMESISQHLLTSHHLEESFDQIANEVADLDTDRVMIQLSLQDFCKSRAAVLKGLSDRLDDLAIPISKTLGTVEAYLVQLQPLLDREITACQRVSSSLFFSEVTNLRSETPPGSGEAFRWALQQPNTDRACGNYLSWLRERTSQNLYWIRGQPGSGKSTLMRYLNKKICRFNSRHLEFNGDNAQYHWLNQSDLLVASYYFWHAGSSIRKSCQSLLQSLLCQIYEARPWLIHCTIMPTRWEAALSLETVRRPWMEEELKANLLKVCDEVTGECNILLLVDGLDEFDGSEEERMAMVKLFESWTSYPHIKVTVSSRPWRIYEGLFTNIPQLKIEELTKDDMHQYVFGTLLTSDTCNRVLSSNHQSCMNLIATDIVRRSRGVFLWARLVVRQILKLSNDGATEEELLTELRRVPDDLNDFFILMLQQLSPHHQRESSSFLQIARTELSFSQDDTLQFSHDGFQFPYLRLSDFDYLTTEGNPYFCLEASFHALTRVEITERYSNLKQQLARRCMGLLEVADGWLSGSVWCSRVVFLHRTVKDFLLQPEAQQTLYQFTDGRAYDAHAFRCNTILANMLTTFTETPLYLPLTEGEILCYQLKTRPQDDESAFDLFERFMNAIPMERHQRSRRVRDTSSLFSAVVHEWRGFRISALAAAVQIDWPAYVRSRLTSESFKVSLPRPLLHYAMRPFPASSNRNRESRPAMVTLLLERGADRSELDSFPTALSKP